MCAVFMKCIAFMSVLILFHQSVADNLLQGDSSFEAGPGDMVTSSFNGQATCTVKCGNAADGKAFAELKFVLPDKVQSRPFPVSPGQDGKLFTFSIYARSDADGLNGRVSMIKNDWSDSIPGTFLPVTKEWKRYSVTGKLKKGKYWLWFEIDKPGIVDVDAFQMEEARQASPYRNHDGIYIGLSIPGENSFVFFEDEKIPVSVFVTSQGKADDPDGSILSVSISDHNRKAVFQREFPVVMKDGIFKTDLDFLPPAFGWFRIKAELIRNKKIIVENKSAFCSVARPLAVDGAKMPFCGTDGAQSSGVMRIGAGNWVQSLVYWKSVEAQKGQYKWPDLKWIHESGRKCKLTIGHLPSAPKWTWAQKELNDAREMGIPLSGSGLLPAPEYLENWRSFIRLTLARYKDQIDLVEIGAEDDLTFGGNSYYLKKFPDDTYKGKLVSGPAYDRYAELIKIACDEIRKTDPALKIGIIRPSNVDCYHYRFSTPTIKACGKLFDIFPLDCYPNGPRYIGPGQPETPLPEDCLPLAVGMALETCRVDGNGQQAYISEFGYALDDTTEADSSYAMEMVKRLVRSYLVARMIPGVETFHWFVTADSCIEAEKYHYGLWRFGMPLPTVPAYSAVARIVENVTEVKELTLGGDSKAVVFKKNGRADAAVWFVRGDGKFVLNELPQSLVVSDVMGNSLSPADTVHVGEFPVYFGMAGNDAFEKMVNILSSSQMICKPVRISFNTPRDDKGVVLFENIAGKNIDMVITVNRIVKNLSLRRREAGRLEIPINGKAVDVSVDCGAGYESLNASFPVSFENCPAIEFKGKIDGDLSEWKDRPFIAMNERSQIMPPDPWIDWKGPKQFSAKVFTGWDETYFYMAAEVVDEVHSNRFLRVIYKGDSIQFAFDPAVNGGTAGYAKDDKELGIAFCYGKSVTAQWAGKGTWKDAEYAVRRDDAAKKTFYEMRIPLASMGIVPEKGTVFGFNFVIFNDDTGAGANYYYQLAPGITGVKNPAQFRKFVLAR